MPILTVFYKLTVLEPASCSLRSEGIYIHRGLLNVLSPNCTIRICKSSKRSEFGGQFVSRAGNWQVSNDDGPWESLGLWKTLPGEFGFQFLPSFFSVFVGTALQTFTRFLKNGGVQLRGKHIDPFSLNYHFKIPIFYPHERLRIPPSLSSVCFWKVNKIRMKSRWSKEHSVICSCLQ